MSGIKIITGSQASISDALAKEFNITTIPYYLNYPNTSLKEGIDITTEDFYKELHNINSLPTTSPPSIGDIQNALRSLCDNHDTMIIITISSKYSQMYNTCQRAIELMNIRNVLVIDSRGATAYQAMMSIRASQLISEGYTIDKLLNWFDTFNTRCEEYIVMDTLKYLEKGGRIGKVKALLSAMISIKPVIVHRDGISTPISKARTHKQALDQILKDMHKKILPQQKIWILLQGIFVEEWLNYVENILYEQFSIEKLYATRMSAITSIHMGPGSWSITYYIV